MSEVLENGLTVRVSAHLSCGRMHFSDTTTQAIYDLKALEQILYEVKKSNDASALLQLYKNSFEFLPKNLMLSAESALEILKNVSNRKS